MWKESILHIKCLISLSIENTVCEYIYVGNLKHKNIWWVWGKPMLVILGLCSKFKNLNHSTTEAPHNCCIIQHWKSNVLWSAAIFFDHINCNRSKKIFLTIFQTILFLMDHKRFFLTVFHTILFLIDRVRDGLNY